MAKMTDKQKRFIEEYLIDFNGTQAAIRAGYSPKSARDIASDLLNSPTKVHIQDEIDRNKAEMSKRLGITRERILNEFAKIAFLDIKDLVTFGTKKMKIGTGKKAKEIDVPFIEIKNSADVDGTAIAEVKHTATGIAIKAFNKVDALTKLGEHLGLFDQDEGDEDLNLTINCYYGAPPGPGEPAGGNK